MKWIMAVAVLAVSPAVDACKSGFKPSDVAGVCVEVDNSQAINPNWVSDEKPPEGRMPSYQRPDVHLIDAPSTTKLDEDADKAKVEADKEGKRTAGIR